MTTLEKLSDDIRMILLASPKSVNIRGLDHLYHLSYEEHINYRRFGFKTLDQLIKAIPNFVKINNYGELVPVLSKKFQELENLIQAPNSTVKRHQQRSRAILVNDDVAPAVTKPSKVRNDLDFLKQLESQIINYNAAEDGVIPRQNGLPNPEPKPTPKPSSVPLKAPVLPTPLTEINVKAPKEEPKPLMNIKCQPVVPPLLPPTRYMNGSSFNQNGQSRVLKTNSSYNKYTKAVNGYHNDNSKPKVTKDNNNNNNRSDVWKELSKSDDIRNYIDSKKNLKSSSESYHQLRNSAKENISVQSNVDSKLNSDVSKNNLLYNEHHKRSMPQNIVKKEERVPMKREQNGFGDKKFTKSCAKGTKNAASDYLNLRISQSNTVPVGQKSSSFVPESLRHKLLNLCISNPKGIWLTDLQKAFETKYSENLRKYFGSSSVLGFCSENKDIFQVVRPGHGDWLVFHVSQTIPEILNDYEDDFVPDRKANVVMSPVAALPEVTDSDVVVIQDNRCNPESENLCINIKKEIIDCDDVDSVAADFPPNVMQNDKELMKQWIPSNLGPGTILKINVLEIFNPRKFWINISRAEYFKETISEVQNYYEVQHSCYKMKKCHLKMNQYCVISFEEKNKMRYRRARIINCFLSSKVVEVFLVDFGFVMDCRIENVFYLKTQFCERPQQAVRAKLYNIEPVDSLWSRKATEKFSELTKKSYLLATVKEIHTDDKILEVILIDDHDENEDEINIGDKLVRLKFAKYTNNQESDSKDEYVTFDDIELSLFPYRQMLTNRNEPLNHLYLPLIFKDCAAKKTRRRVSETNCLSQLNNQNDEVIDDNKCQSDENRCPRDLEYFFEKFKQIDSNSVTENKKIGLINGYRKDNVNSRKVVINRTRVHNLFRKGSSSSTDNDGDDDESDEVSDSERRMRIRSFNMSRHDNDSTDDTESDSDNS